MTGLLPQFIQQGRITLKHGWYSSLLQTSRRNSLHLHKLCRLCSKTPLNTDGQGDVAAQSQNPHDNHSLDMQDSHVINVNEILMSTANNAAMLQKSADNKSHQRHIPVMAEEVLDILQPQNGRVYLDMTFGAGGHTSKILEMAPECKVYALDRDPTAHHLAKEMAKKCPQVVPLLGRFTEVHRLLSQHGVTRDMVDGVLMDLGASSMQFDGKHRGFSISHDGPLDMRMDANREPDQLTAADVVNNMDEGGLMQILKKYGEEKRARHIARAIVDSRYAFGKITTTQQLAEIVAALYPTPYLQDRLGRPSHAATKTFQALRIFVNNELNELNNGLEIVHKLLTPGGVCVAISFHSLEDRIVKRHFHGIDIDAKFNMNVRDQHRNSARIEDETEVQKYVMKRWEPLSRKVYVPSEREERYNPRSRSAKLRAAYKL